MLRNPIFQGWGLSPSGSAHELSGMKRQFLLTHHFRSLRSRTRSQTCNINSFGSRKFTLQIQTINAPQFYQMAGDSQNSFFKFPARCIKGLDTPSQNRKIAPEIHFFFLNDVKSIRR